MLLRLAGFGVIFGLVEVVYQASSMVAPRDDG